MTLADLIPSLRPMLAPALDPAPWPLTAAATGGGDISVGGIPRAEVARRYGTPAYVVDEDDARERCRTYRATLRGEVAVHGGTSRVLVRRETTEDLLARDTA